MLVAGLFVYEGAGAVVVVVAVAVVVVVIDGAVVV